jgi:hypothetical protein
LAVPIFLEVAARHVEDRVGIELVLVAPEGAEGDSFRMAEEPGRLVISGSGPLVKDGNPKQNREGGALSAQGAAGRDGGTRGGRHVAKIGGGEDPVAYCLAGMYICELVHKRAPKAGAGAEDQRSHQVREAERQ